MRQAQTLGQQQFQFVTEPLPPMAEVGSFMPELMLEKLFAGEVLEIGIIDPALAHAFIRQPVNVFEQQQPDHEACRDPGPPFVAVKRSDLAVDKVPVDLCGQPRQFMIEVDDLVQLGLGTDRLISSSRASSVASFSSDAPTESCFAKKGNRKNQIASFRGPRPRNLAIPNPTASQKPTPHQWLRNYSQTTW
jgi:hypothetical protein